MMNSTLSFRSEPDPRLTRRSVSAVLRVRSQSLPLLRSFALAALALLALAPSSARAELIPAERLTNWIPGVTVGVPGGIPTNRTNIIDVSLPPYNADKTGVNDCGAAFAAALAASKEGDVIYFPAGTFRFNNTFGTGLNIHNRTIRGAGMDVTYIDSRTTSLSAINIGTGSSFNYPVAGNTITAGLSKGSTTLTMGNTSDFRVGELVQIEFENMTDDARIAQGATPVISVSGFPYMRRQMTRVTGKTSTTLSIFPGIYHSPQAGLSARVTQSYWYTVGMGLEDFTLLNANNSAVFGIHFQDCIGSWIRNVKSKNASNYHVFFAKSLQSEIRGCHFDSRKSGGTNGAGILFDGGSGNLVEDNIVEKVFPLIEVNHGASGNVFAYNMFDGNGMNVNHGPHNSHNLYEGNVTPWIQSDGYFGGASEETFFRNWISGVYKDSGTQTFIIGLNRFARNYSFVGNLLGNSVWPHGASPYSFGNPNMGNSSYEGSHKMSAGSFPKDWKMNGVLTKRNSNTSGELTLNSGSLRVNQFRAYMSNGVGEMVISAVNGNVVTFSTTGGTLPAQGTTVSILAGIQGFQDLDLDVEVTTIRRSNAHLFGAGAPRIPTDESLGNETLPASLFRTSKPAYFGDLNWPPFDPLNPNPTYTSIPAGIRYVNGTVPPPISNPPTASNQAPSNVRILRQ